MDHHKIQLSGSVCGLESCHIATDQDTVRVGSALNADLVVTDPLVPPTAFVVRRHKQHGESARPCACRWALEVHPQARVYVNRRLSRGERLAFGDTIASGCHEFTFAPADPQPRNRKSNTTVSDVCATLLKRAPLPPGYLPTCPWHRHARRLRRALAWAGGCGLLVLLAFLIAAPPPVWEPIQLPVEVTVLADRIEVPSPDAVRSLKDVQRRTMDPVVAPDAAPLNKPTPAPALEIEAQPVAMTAPPPEPLLAKTPVAPAALAPADLKGIEQAPGAINREPERLAANAPARRLTVREATLASAGSDLQPMQAAAMAPLAVQARAIAPAANPSAAVPNARLFDGDRARRLDALAAFKPSPVRFETAGEHPVPVARMAEALAPLEGGAGEDYQVDGKITEGEIAKSWKSGRFRAHAPGNPPPEANPATYCYVGKSEVGGKPCLYISFLCADPHTDQIIAGVTQNVSFSDKSMSILNDDSVEIFLDTDNDRRTYHQLIVNSRGAYWPAYFPGPVPVDQYQDWNPQATVKTTINKEAGQWVCEVLIPFERLGGVPAKGTRWTVNFCRNYRGQKADWQLQSWFEVYTQARNFHRPERFGMFEW